MNDEIWDLINKRHCLKNRNLDEYKRLNKLILKKCNTVKEEWLNNKCIKIKKNDKKHKRSPLYNKWSAGMDWWKYDENLFHDKKQERIGRQ